MNGEPKRSFGDEANCRLGVVASKGRLGVVASKGRLGVVASKGRLGVVGFIASGFIAGRTAIEDCLGVGLTGGRGDPKGLLLSMALAK
jgi:hypothetical protein